MHTETLNCPAFYFVLLSGMFLAGCSRTGTEKAGILIVSEPAGIARDLEYVEVDIPAERLPEKNEAFFIDDNNGNMTKGQSLHIRQGPLSGYVIRCLFPVRIKAGQTRRYAVTLAKNTATVPGLKVTGAGMALVIENNYYIAELTDEKATAESGLGAGQLATLTLKRFKQKKLQRTGINMHWAPNFKKKGMAYKTIGHIRAFDSVSVSRGPYRIRVYRSGRVKGYEEIRLEGEYRFYAGLPYFIFSSTMIMGEDVVLTMLRNDEMTMDSLFTHAMFPLPDGKVKIVPLYDKPPRAPHYSVKELRKTPIAANTNWFCFFNDSLKYGFGSIRLQYDYTNDKGGQSPMLNPETRITYSRKGGRYWDRRFVFTREDSLLVPRGSRYFEQNAYLIFKTETENPAQEITEYFMRLSHPLTVNYEQQRSNE